MVPLRNRDRQPELMDQPGLNAAVHQQALEGLKRVNFFSRTVDAVFRSIREYSVAGNGRPLRVLDIASGGGDVAIEVARRAARHGISMDVTGCDISPTAVDLARQAATAAHLTNVQFFVHDAILQDLPSRYDVVMCTLFLHHLSEGDTVTVLRRMAATSTGLVIVDDLVRTRWGYVLAWVGCRLLSRSPIVHVDGPLSVRAAYTQGELQKLAEQAGLTNARFRRHWPERLTMVWNQLENRGA